ncbi:hypothetical protein [Mesorhizobium sp. M0663]|uniref:hypothetical protein n=1 Tax=Mesorhizobium sp. M0663 TaxID=2956981 RepID=UPI00333639A3
MKVLGLQESDDATIRAVDYKITADDKLVFSLPDISGIKEEKFSLGPASTIVGLVVKFGQGMPEIQAIHANSDAAPMIAANVVVVRRYVVIGVLARKISRPTKVTLLPFNDLHRSCPGPTDERRILAGDLLDRLQQRLMHRLERSVVIAGRRYERLDDALVQPFRFDQEAR